MFGDNKISAVLVSTDLEVSQDFYKNRVGLTLSPDTVKKTIWSSIAAMVCQC